jgi:hypothetical protein
MRDNSVRERGGSPVKGSEESARRKALFRIVFPGCGTGLF